MELLNPLSQADFPGRTVAYTASAGNTTDWNPGPEGVVIWSTTPCYVEVGPAAVATTASTPNPCVYTNSVLCGYGQWRSFPSQCHPHFR